MSSLMSGEFSQFSGFDGEHSSDYASELGRLSAQVFVAATGYKALTERANCLAQMGRMRQIEKCGVNLPPAVVERPITGLSDLVIRRYRSETSNKVVEAERRFEGLFDAFFSRASDRVKRGDPLPEAQFSRVDLDVAAGRVVESRSSTLLLQLSEFELGFNEYLEGEALGRFGARAYVGKIHYLDERERLRAFIEFAGGAGKLPEEAKKAFAGYGAHLRDHFLKTREYLVTAQGIYREQAVGRYGEVERVLDIPRLWLMPDQERDIKRYADRQIDPGLKKAYYRTLERSELYSSPELRLGNRDDGRGEPEAAVRGR